MKSKKYLPPTNTEDCYPPKTPLLPKPHQSIKTNLPPRHQLKILAFAESIKTELNQIQITIIPNNTPIEIIDSKNQIIPLIETLEQKYTWLNQTFIAHLKLAIQKLNSPYSLELENISTFAIKTNLQNKLTRKIAQTTLSTDKNFLNDLIYWQNEIIKTNWNNIYSLQKLLIFYKSKMLIENPPLKP